MRPLLRASVLDKMRRTLYGSEATLKLYSVTPLAGETLLATLRSGFYVQRKKQLTNGVDNAVVILLASTADISIADLRDNAIAKVTLGDLTRSYKVIALTETQQVGGGWVLHCEPASNTV